MAWSVLKDPSNEATLRNGFSGGSSGAAPLSTSGTSQDAKCCEIGSLYSKVAAVFVGRTIGRRSPCKIGWTGVALWEGSARGGRDQVVVGVFSVIIGELAISRRTSIALQ